MKKGTFGKLLVILAVVFIACFALTACELSEPAVASKFFINDNAANQLNKDSTTRDDAITGITDGIENLRMYLDSADMATTGYYMGMEFNIDTLDPATLKGGNFRLKIQAHLFTYPYEDEDGNPIYKYYNPKDGKYYDQPDAEGTYEKIKAEDIHNEAIKKSDILIEWYNGATNEMLIGMYFDGLNSNSDDPGNILYLNIQGYKRSFYDFGDTVLYRQLIRLLMSLSVEKLLTAGNIQGDAGTSSIRSLFEIAVTDNYKVVLNDPVKSTLFYSMGVSAVAGTLTDFIHGIFAPFENKVDPLVLKYLGFKFSVVGNAIINSVDSDMQFFTEPDPTGAREIMTGAYLTFVGSALSAGAVYNYTSDVSFDYGTYPPEDMVLDKDYYTPYEYGQYEFTGNLYIPMLNANYDALIRTDMQQYDNSTNNVFMEYRDIANGELMIGGYYRYEKLFIDITGLEYLYGWIDLNELGFPKVYDEHLNLAEALGSFFRMVNNGIVSIVDAILSPDKNDKENHLLEEIMKKTTPTEKDPNDIFSINSETLTVDMVLVKAFLYETGQGTYTTRDIINMLDSMLPYTMDQIAIMLGVANAEIMLDNSYFELRLNVDTNEITIKMFTNVGREMDEPALMIFQLDLVPVVVGQKVNIATVNFDGFKPLEQIYTYSATMRGDFIFSTAETVDLSKLLSSTIGENSGLNTPYQLPKNAGVSFELIYDQFVTDHAELDGEGNVIVHKAGRSAFQLQVYLTGGHDEDGVMLRLASDDVAFSSDVYNEQPQRAGELGYIWVSIECVKDNNTQRIPKVKIREDVFMNSMQAYMNGTRISDTAAELGKNEVNLSITSILFALVEDAYVVAEPEQLEITSSNDTLQSIFRVKGLIGNIRVDAGFRKRVDGLQAIKRDYGMYQVGQFENISGNSPYDTPLHSTVPVYFYDDYSSVYPEYSGIYIKFSDATEQQKETYGDRIYYKELNSGKYIEKDFATDEVTRYENVFNSEDRKRYPVEYIFAGWTQLYSMRVDKKRGTIQMYDFRGKVTIFREKIENESSSFFNGEDANNQNIAKVKFDARFLSFVYQNERDGSYHYTDYYGEDIKIDDRYVELTPMGVYIYYLGITDMIYHAGATEYYYFDSNFALKDEAGEDIYLATRADKKFLFEYDEDSVAIPSDVIKRQYAPRINGSFMGTIRRYIVTFTSQLNAELGKVFELNEKTYYSEEDENHTIPVFDEKGIQIREDLVPRVLYVMEPCEPLAEEVRANVHAGGSLEFYDFPAQFVIDWDSVTLKGTMVETDVIIAPGMMGETIFPVRIIVTNREIATVHASADDDTDNFVTVFVDETSNPSLNVPVVDVIDLDPFDYMIKKNEFFTDINNYAPDMLGMDGDDPEYLRVYRQREREFVNKYFQNYIFNIAFKYEVSNLRAMGVKEEYIATSYTNDPTNVNERYNWEFDRYENGLYTEDKISIVSAVENKTYTVLYLHTYFKGQLIALQVNVQQRLLAYVTFGDEDDFGQKYQEVNAGLTPDDPGYVYGHYVANYFDADSYTLPTNPTFWFTDGAGNYFSYPDLTAGRLGFFDIMHTVAVKDKDSDYFLISDTALVNFELAWGDPEIKNIGSNGSYYYDDGVLVNRPFYESNVKRDENGTVIEEGEPTPTANGTDITSSSINWFHIFSVYKQIRENGIATGKWLRIPLIAGTAQDNGFPTTVIRITVECPKLEVALATNEAGNVISRTDDFDFDNDGNKKYFSPSAIDAGEAIGYYSIDPLDTKTLEIPTSVVIYFENENGTRMSRHRFSGIDWCASFDNNGNPVMTNESGYEILRKEVINKGKPNEQVKYYYNLSTEEEKYTQIRAKIGSEVSGYQYIYLCLHVLNKEPQEVEFYVGDMPNGTLMRGIERADITYYDEQQKETNAIFYTYYVNTFADFKMPNYIRAYFGVNKDRSEYYSVTWTRLDGKTSIYYTPNTICNLKATIGTGDVTITIYLSVVVANYEIVDNGISLADEIRSYYVRIGDSNEEEYALVGDLLTTNVEEKTLGLYKTEDGVEKFVLISMGQQNYAGVDAGYIGLYTRNDMGDYVLRETLSPYEFTERVYNAINIAFEDGKAVTMENLSELAIGMENGENVLLTQALQYRYENSLGRNITEIKFAYSNAYGTYLPKYTDGKISLYKTDGDSESFIGLYAPDELAYTVMNLVLAQDINDKGVAFVDGESYLEDNITLRQMYNYSNGTVRFLNRDGQEFTFGSLELDDGTVISYEELKYRLAYFNAHRVDKNQIAFAVANKKITINNVEGLFSVNDTVRPSDKTTFVESKNYIVELGTGSGAYDVRIRLVFDGGYRLIEDDTVAKDLAVYPYSVIGVAQYGANGYIFGNEVSERVEAVKGNGAGLGEFFEYGQDYGTSSEKLLKWYVENVTGNITSVKRGEFITYLPQSLIYSQRESGYIEVSTLTKEGFRIKKNIILGGAPSVLTTFESINDVGLLAIREGVILINDIYDYLPVTDYFTGGERLPTTLKVLLNGNMVDVSNVTWKLDSNWLALATELTYRGTFNRSTGMDDRRLMATAEILGWETVEDGKVVRKDSVRIDLYISIRSSQVVALPWKTGTLQLDSTAIVTDKAEDTRVYYIDADAYNDAESSAMRSSSTTIPSAQAVFTLPTYLTVQYESGNTHTFQNVKYKFRGYDITEIPFTNAGLDKDAFVDMFRNRGISIDADSLDINYGDEYYEGQYVELTVDIGLFQTITLRVRFFDKTVKSTSALIEPDDVYIRSAILSAMEGVNNDKTEEIYNQFNQTRIRVNVETLYAQAVRIFETVNARGWSAVTLNYDTTVVETDAISTAYRAESLYDYAVTKLKQYLGSSDSISAGRMTSAYDYLLGEYVKLELTRVFERDMGTYSSNDLSYSIYYKNKLEASFDYDNAIREIYRIRDYVGEKMLNSDDATALYIAVLEKEAEKAIARASSFFTDVLGDNSKRYVSREIKETVDKLFLFRIGVNQNDDVTDIGGYRVIDMPIRSFVGSYAAATPKAELRIELRKMVGDALNLSRRNENTGVDNVPEILGNLITHIVHDVVENISNFAIGVSAMRLNLLTGSDITSRLDMLISNGIKDYIRNVFMEGKIVTEIKKVQKINVEEGTYYIDPYYDYIVLPNKVLMEFDERTGGFAYTTEVSWNNDNVSGNVTYKGNGKNSVYGYVYMWTEGQKIYENNRFLAEIDEEVENNPSIKDRSWNQIKSASGSISDVILILESNAFLSLYYTDEELQTIGREKCIIELYKRYVKGKKLLDTEVSTVNAAGVSYTAVKGLYNYSVYATVNATVNNVNTKRTQELSLVVVVKDRTLLNSELRVLDNDGNQWTEVPVENPFKYSVKDLPNRIKVGDEYLEIVWSDVSITPLGNLNASTFDIYGNIKNAGGQQVQIKLYVNRWEYAGMTKNGQALNPLNFYFSDSLRYSSEESYEVRFNVYSYGNPTPKYQEVTFYPEDSVMLVNTVDDSKMAEVLQYRNYVIYWDEMAINSAAAQRGIAVEGDVALGNERVGTHNLTSLTLGSSYIGPKKGRYIYEDMSLTKLGMEVLDEEYYMGLSGNAVVVTSLDRALPTTAKIEINKSSNVNYDEDKCEVRVLWNYTYADALSRLIRFVEYAYPQIEEGARASYATSIIMNYAERSETARAEMEDLAVEYYKARLQTNPDMTEQEIRKEAKQLLMYDETYDFNRNPLDIKGGAVIKRVTVLVRYEGSDYIRQISFNVRIIFADYSSKGYYIDNPVQGGDNPAFIRLERVTGYAPTELYVGVRTDYWNEEIKSTQGEVLRPEQSGYDTDGTISPYDNVNKQIYEILDLIYGGNDEDSLFMPSEGVRLIKVTGIVYKQDERGNYVLEDGCIVSESYYIDGIRYTGDLIKIRVA